MGQYGRQTMPAFKAGKLWAVKAGISCHIWHIRLPLREPIFPQGQQSNQPYGDTSLEGDISEFMPLNTSTPSHASQGKKLCTRRTAKQPHIGASSNSEEASSDEEGDIVGDFDPDNCYLSSSKFPKVVNDYIEKRFRRCIPREQRIKMLRDNPIPSTPAAKVPQVDDDIVAFLG